jgi:hypothetical protein
VRKLVDEPCIHPRMAVRCQETCPEGLLSAPPAYYHRNCGCLDGLQEGREGIATVPAPDSYPHVTCG